MKSRAELSTRVSSAIRLEQYAEELYRFLLRRLRRKHEAEDLLQAVYVRFLQTPHNDLVRQPRAYLYRIATNLLGEFSLRTRRNPVIYDSETATHTAEHATPAQIAEDVFGDRLALEQQLQRVVMQLPRTYRTVLLLRVVEGLSFKDIAARCGITEQSARKYLARAMALCRTANWEK